MRSLTRKQINKYTDGTVMVSIGGSYSGTIAKVTHLFGGFPMPIGFGVWFTIYLSNSSTGAGTIIMGALSKFTNTIILIMDMPNTYDNFVLYFTYKSM